MPRPTRLALAAAAALLSLLGVAPALAQARPTIVVMGEDSDEDSVPRGNRIFQRVIAELGETMNVRGYNVYDETAVAMGLTQPGRVRRRDAELIDVARAIHVHPQTVRYRLNQLRELFDLDDPEERFELLLVTRARSRPRRST